MEMPDELSEIRKSFKSCFGNDADLPDIVPQRGSNSDLPGRSAWLIHFVLIRDEQDRPQLHFTGEHRMTNPWHCRIDFDGSVHHLESYWESYSFDPKIPGDEDRKREEYYAHNRRIGQILIDKGLLPLHALDGIDDGEK